MISSALPVFAVEPTVAVPAFAADSTQGASLSGTFADLLLDAEAASGDVESQAPTMVAPKMPKLAVAEEGQDEDVPRPEGLQDAPIEVAALAYALVTAIPMDTPVVQEVPVAQGVPIVQRINEATPPVKVASTKAAAVPVGQPRSTVSLDRLTHVSGEVAAVETQEIAVSDTSITQGSLLHSRDSSQALPLTWTESDLHEETATHSAVPASAPIKGPTAMKMLKMSEPVTVAEVPQQTEPVVAGESVIRREPLAAVMNDTATRTAPIVLEAHIVPKKQDIESKPVSESIASPDLVAPKDSVRPVQDSVETNLETSEDDHETTHQETPPQRGHTPVIRPDTLVTTDSASSRVSAPRHAGHEPVRQPQVVPEEKPGATAQPAPLKHLDIRIPDANGGVTVRVHEHAGGVQVSVRTSDAQIAGNIAETLPDLTRQLDRHGFRAETWTPSKESALLSEQAVDADSQSGASHPQHVQTEPAQEDNQTQDNNRRPEWEERPRRRPKPVSIEDFKEHLS